MLKVTVREPVRISLFFALSLAFTLLHSHNSFFWDSVNQVSVPANWYFDNNFRHLLLPEEIATGHQPFVGLYLAFIWKILGRNLPVSHLAMFPFIFGIFCQLYNLIKRSGTKTSDSMLIMLLVLCDATLISQMSMITFDVPHTFFFLWCLNSIFDNKRASIAFSFGGLMLTSLRSSLSGFAIIPFSIFYYYKRTADLTLRKLVPFAPGLMLFILFLVASYLKNHWLIFNPESTGFTEFSGIASGKQILRNIGLVGWRLSDYGRFGIWLALMVIIIFSNKRRIRSDNYFRNILNIALCQFAIFFFIVIMFKNPFGHRYFLPVIIPVNIAVAYWLLRYSRLKYLSYSLILITLFSGYFWIYPLKISQGWDATPAHWPYFKIRKEMMMKIRVSNISLNEIGTFFPNTSSARVIDLEDDDTELPDADPETHKYILYSNVYNVDDRFIDELLDQVKWEIRFKERHNRIFMILFEKKSE